MMRNINIEILMGLPGSGKTHYAKSRENRREHTCAMFCDELSGAQMFGRAKSLTEIVGIGCNRIPSAARTVIVDGLFLTNEDVIQALREINEWYNPVYVTIHQWNEDRATCLKNDGGRREVRSAVTIQNAVYETADLAIIRNALQDTEITVAGIVEHTVELKPDWERYWRPHVSVEDGKMYSQSWCCGGVWKDCWDGSSPVSSEEPYEFVELYELLEKVAPQLTFLQYKLIQSTCISTNTYGESDYYGGGVTKCRWVCDLVKLYAKLSEFGYAEVES